MRTVIVDYVIRFVLQLPSPPTHKLGHPIHLTTFRITCFFSQTINLRQHIGLTDLFRVCSQAEKSTALELPLASRGGVEE